MFVDTTRASDGVTNSIASAQDATHRQTDNVRLYCMIRAPRGRARGRTSRTGAVITLGHGMPIVQYIFVHENIDLKVSRRLRCTVAPRRGGHAGAHGEGVIDRLPQLALAAIGPARCGQQDAAVAVENDEGGVSDDLDEAGELAFLVPVLRPVLAGLLGEIAPQGRLVLVGADAQQHERLVLHLRGETLDRRIGLAAGTAPGRPKIDQYRLSFERIR